MQSISEFLVNFPKHGSFVSYAKEFISDTFACGAGWTYWISWVGYVPAEAVECGIVLKNFLPLHPNVYSIIVLGLISAINLFQVTWFGHIESLLSLLKIAQ
jgi:AAT family amino acid transporter